MNENMKKQNRGVLFILSVIVLLFSATQSLVAADLQADEQALLDFIQGVPHSRTLNWNQNSSICTNWTGVTCNDGQSRVTGLHLPGIGLKGLIPSNTLTRLSAIQTISLRSNGISGHFPSDFSKLTSLTYLYLEFNNFSGSLPQDFSVWKNLTVANLSNNAFSGNIPPSISNSTLLTSLDLSHNLLSGEIPNVQLPSLQQLSLANNNLTGVVPKSLQRFPPQAFTGNNLTHQYALPPAYPLEPPSAQSAEKRRKLSEPAILGIAIGGCVLAFVVIALFMAFGSSNKGKQDTPRKEKSNKKEAPTRKAASEIPDKKNRLVFFEGYDLAFDLEDLLRASAEILGKGTFGMTYRAGLEDATTVVVKRLKEVATGKREFEQQMEVVGRIKHENVAALRAYYYSKDEKLTVYDYFDKGSVSAMLHGNRGEGRIPLDWDTRLSTAIGAAKGIAHIHNQNSGKLVHGNIKASNIFLNSQGCGCVSEVGLATLMSPITQPALRFAGYRAPEVTDTRKATHASDVFSYGVLLLELLTGRSSIHATGSEEIVHLVRWVHSVVREEWTAEVFDVELLRYPNIEEEMVQMLQIAMACVEKMPEQRPKMVNVVRMVEEIRPVQKENRSFSASTSEFSTPTAAAALSQAMQIGISTVLP